MGRIATAVTATRNAIGKPVTVRALKSFVTDRQGFDPGAFYKIPAGDFADWCKAGMVRAATDSELADAEFQISSRVEVD